MESTASLIPSRSFNRLGLVTGQYKNARLFTHINPLHQISECHKRNVPHSFSPV